MRLCTSTVIINITLFTIEVSGSPTQTIKGNITLLTIELRITLLAIEVSATLVTIEVSVKFQK